MIAGGRAAAQAVIAGPFTLDPSYRHLFQADNNTSPEIIFPIIQDGLIYVVDVRNGLLDLSQTNCLLLRRHRTRPLVLCANYLLNVLWNALARMVKRNHLSKVTIAGLILLNDRYV